MAYSSNKERLQNDAKFLKFVANGNLKVNIKKGRVLNAKNNKELCSVNKNRKNKTVLIMYSHNGLVHAITRARLVWLVSNGPISDPKILVSHIEDTMNDRIDNLMLRTTSEVMKITKRNQPVLTGCIKPTLSEKDVQEIRFLAKECGWTRLGLAKRYNISKPSVHCILHNSTWKSCIGKTDKINPAELRNMVAPTRVHGTVKATVVYPDISANIPYYENKHPVTTNSMKKIILKYELTKQKLPSICTKFKEKGSVLPRKILYDLLCYYYEHKNLLSLDDKASTNEQH